MTPPRHRRATLAALALIALASTVDRPATAQDRDPRRDEGGGLSSRILDHARMFGPEALGRAESELAGQERASKVPVVVETVESLAGEPIDEVALKRARQLGPGGGVYLLISKQDHKISAPLVRRQFESRFPVEKRAEIRDAMIARFKKGEFDDGLRDGVSTLVGVLRASPPSESRPRASEPEPGRDGPPGALVEKDRRRLTLGGARAVLAAGESKAVAARSRMAIAVVDDGGQLLAFIRMDDVRPAAVSAAVEKAQAAASTGRPTAVEKPAPRDAPPADDPLGPRGSRMFGVPGGVPILFGGQVVGAVGASGGSNEEDAAVAQAASVALGSEAGEKDGQKVP